MDEADLLALLEDEGGNSPITCSCTEKCSAGKVNTACPICSTNMSECAGKEAAPADPEPTEPTEEPKKSNVGGILAIVLILALGGGAAVWYFKVRKPKADTIAFISFLSYDGSCLSGGLVCSFPRQIGFAHMIAVRGLSFRM